MSKKAVPVLGIIIIALVGAYYVVDKSDNFYSSHAITKESRGSGSMDAKQKANVIVYTTNYCPYCVAAKNLLKNKGIAFKEIDVTNDLKAREELIEKTGGRRTVPQIFIDEKPVGGFTDIEALDNSGELDSLVFGK